MIDHNLIQETLFSIKRNKTRSILAGFGVAWGIFILIILLGAGTGFQEGILKLFSDFSKNSVWFFGGYNSKTKKAGIKGMQITFTPRDIMIIKNHFDEIDKISPEANLTNALITGKNDNHGNFQVRGVKDNYFAIKTLKMAQGRYFNVLDINNKRRVTIVGERIAEVLYPNHDIIGQSICINNVYFKVVGVIESGTMMARNEQNAIYLPYSSFMDCYKSEEKFKNFCTVLKNDVKTVNFERDVRHFLARRLHFDPSDKKALYTMNFRKQTKSFKKLFNGINIFLWIIGISFLLSGIAGIGNIMLVIVKERTTEIGIRKSIGASPSAILKMILVESIFITVIAGIIGLLFGAFIITIINKVIIPMIDNKDMLIAGLGIDLPIIIACLIILILSGIIAGMFPARKASMIMPVQALQMQ